MEFFLQRATLQLIFERLLKQITNSDIDFIEIGLPFSDPMADGPLIESSEVALKNNASVSTCLNIVKILEKKIMIYLLS